MTAPATPLPGWPPVLHEAWAAAYLALSPSTFRTSVVPEVPPVQLTHRRIGWLRTDLDAWLARRAPAGQASEGNVWHGP